MRIGNRELGIENAQSGVHNGACCFDSPFPIPQSRHRSGGAA